MTEEARAVRFTNRLLNKLHYFVPSETLCCACG